MKNILEMAKQRVPVHGRYKVREFVAPGRPCEWGAMIKRLIGCSGLLCALAMCSQAYAQEFEVFGISGNIKSRVAEGLAWRLQNPDSNLIYKDNLNPGLCGFTDQNSCYSFNGDQRNNAKLVAAPGAYFGANRDDGDLNYRRGQITSALTKFSSDISASYGDFTFKAGALFYFDPINYNFDNTHPDTNFQPYRQKRQHDIANEAGKSWVLKDLLVAGKFTAMDHDFNMTVGYQHIRWGESTLVALNSVSEINAPDARLLYQPGTQIAEVFRPTPAIALGTQLINNVNLDLIYMFGWDPVKVPAGGTFQAPYDVIKTGTALLSLGQFHEDPNKQQRLPGVGKQFSDTSLTIPFDSNTHARSQGQYGAKLTVFAPDFNGGTEFGFYALNYHSRLPYLSFHASDATCVKETTADIITATNDCNGFKTVTGGKEGFPADTSSGFADYPEDIHMLGASFNTTVGKWSLAGELSYRPNLPVQIVASDLLYAADQPALPNHDLHLGFGTATQLLGLLGNPTAAANTLVGLGTNPQLAVDLAESPRFRELLSGIVSVGQAQVLSGQAPSDFVIPSRRHAIPDYTSVYRGQTIQANQYIPGYERLHALQLDFTGIHILSSTENPIGADQVVFIAELGMTYFPNMPSKSRLQFEAGDLQDTHASAGADGSGDPAGTPVGQQPDGSYAASRLNPHQQTSGFATPFSTGYRLIVRGEYDQFLFGWNYKPQVIWMHDIYGTAPLPMQNFVEGAKTWQWINEVEFNNSLSAQIFWQGSTGGGTVNYQRDKDTAGFTVTYQF
jgi:hypothetical protein